MKDQRRSKSETHSARPNRTKVAEVRPYTAEDKLDRMFQLVSVAVQVWEKSRDRIERDFTKSKHSGNGADTMIS